MHRDSTKGRNPPKAITGDCVVFCGSRRPRQEPIAAGLPRQIQSGGLHEPAPVSFGRRGPPQLRNALPARPRWSSALSLDRLPAAYGLATVLRASTAGPLPAQTRQRSPEGLKPRSTARSGPMSPPVAGRGHRWAARRSAGGRDSASDRSLRRGRQGDTVEAIAPDAAALRSRQCLKADGLRFVLDVTSDYYRRSSRRW
jgi:hypothetical protein